MSHAIIAAIPFLALAVLIWMLISRAIGTGRDSNRKALAEARLQYNIAVDHARRAALRARRAAIRGDKFKALQHVTDLENCVTYSQQWADIITSIERS